MAALRPEHLNTHSQGSFLRPIRPIRLPWNSFCRQRCRTLRTQGIRAVLPPGSSSVAQALGTQTGLRSDEAVLHSVARRSVGKCVCVRSTLVLGGYSLSAN